jgi:hypothetical protein
MHPRIRVDIALGSFEAVAEFSDSLLIVRLDVALNDYYLFKSPNLTVDRQRAEEIAEYRRA